MHRAPSSPVPRNPDELWAVVAFTLSHSFESPLEISYQQSLTSQISWALILISFYLRHVEGWSKRTCQNLLEMNNLLVIKRLVTVNGAERRVATCVIELPFGRRPLQRTGVHCKGIYCKNLALQAIGNHYNCKPLRYLPNDHTTPQKAFQRNRHTYAKLNQINRRISLSSAF